MQSTVRDDGAQAITNALIKLVCGNSVSVGDLIIISAVKPMRLPLAEPQKHNKAHALIAPDGNVAAARVAFTSKGTNPNKQRVYGDDNLAKGDGVPTEAVLLTVPGVDA